MNKQKALKILHIDSNVSIEEIKSAYRRRAKQFHPDRFNNESSLKEKAEARMKEINLAFQTLYHLHGSDENTYKPGKSDKNLYEKFRESGRIFYVLLKGWLGMNPDRPYGRYKKNKKQQGIFCNWSTPLNAFNLFYGFFKKDYRGKTVKKENDREKLKKNKRSMEKAHSFCPDTCRNSEKKRKLRSFDVMLKQNLERENHFPSVGEQCHNKRSNFCNTRVGSIQRIRRRKRFIDTGSGHVQRISPIARVKKIT